MMHSVGETTIVCKCSDDWVNIWIRGLDLCILTKRKKVVVEYKTTVISSRTVGYGGTIAPPKARLLMNATRQPKGLRMEILNSTGSW